MYSLPAEYWKEETLRDIGNSLGTFIKAFEETKTHRYTSYARICVQMHLTKALTDSVSLFHDDFEWIQTLDYEHIPFRCRKCHEHGHLFRDFPLNPQPKPPVNDLRTNSEGFTKIPNRRRHAKKSTPTPDSSKKLDSLNRFSILTPLDPPKNPLASPLANPELPSPSRIPNPPRPSSDSDPSSLPISPAHKKLEPEIVVQSSSMDLEAALILSTQDNTLMEDQKIPSKMDEYPESISLEGLDILKLETAYKQKEYNTILPWEIERLEGVLSKAQHNKCLGIQAGSPWDGKKILKETKKRGHKMDLQRTIILGELLMESGRFPKLTKFYKSQPHIRKAHYSFSSRNKSNSTILEKILRKIWVGCSSVTVDASGASGGLAIIWNPQLLTLQDFHTSHFFIQATFHLIGTYIHGHLSNVYFPQQLNQKLALLDTLTILNSNREFPLWIGGGDFNIIRALEEKSGGKSKLEGDSIGFRNYIQNNHLMDIHTSNGVYTWSNKRRGSQHIASRLDRFLISDNAIHLGGDFHASIGPQGGSGHWPIMLQWARLSTKSNRPFRF
eukprot:PITA_34473